MSRIAFPVDIQEMEAGKGRSKRNVGRHTSDVFARSARLPDETELRRAAEILDAGTRVAILAGRGALHATDALEAIAEHLAAPIVKALLGKAAIPDDSPYTTGCVGLLGTRPSQEALEECDTLLMVGTSFVKYGLPVKVVIVKNNTLGQIKWEQMAFLGNPEYGCELQPMNFALFAHACGGAGFTIDDPARCGAVLDEALSNPGPVIVEAVVDPLEPPLPAKVTLDQAKHLAQALVRGEPNREKIALTVLRDRVRELI